MKKILIVDDSGVQRKMITQIIRKAGFENEIIEACDGKDAIQKLAANLADIGLVLSDWNMPNMTGLEFIEKIKTVPQIETLPVMMVTTEGTEERMKIAHEHLPSLAGYIIKPFTPEQLRAKIEPVLSKQ